MRPRSFALVTTSIGLLLIVTASKESTDLEKLETDLEKLETDLEKLETDLEKLETDLEKLLRHYSPQLPEICVPAVFGIE